MTTKSSVDLIRLEPYSEDDLPLLKRANMPEMTEHPGGPESDEKILQRHQRYLDSSKTGNAQTFKFLWGEKSEYDFEYILCNDWRFDLYAARDLL